MRITTRTARLGLVSAAAGIICLPALAGIPAHAAGADGVNVLNTETVKIYMTADAKKTTYKQVYEQLVLSGKGSVDLRNPISAKGLRNIDGFGGFEVKNGEQIVRTDVDGQVNYRSASDFDGEVPVTIEATYVLDGKTITPKALVGKSGNLAVEYVVTNVTAQPQELEIPDGKGGVVRRTVDVPLPVVGSLSTTVPQSFTDVASETANKAGDGRGGTTLSYTMTLLPPVGGTTASFGYTAKVKNAVVPRVEVTALPVNPLDNPTLASAAASYQSGADTGAQLAAGAGEIDENLLKLRDGAAELLSGLLQLNAGAGELSSGLGGQIVPGARKLADGAGDLNAGLGKLDGGAKQLHAGSGDAVKGSKKLTGGLKQISGGLNQLAGQLPAAETGMKKLQQGVDQIVAGFGSESQPGTLINGLAQLEGGAQGLGGGLGQLRGGLNAAKGGVDGSKAGVDQVKGNLDGGFKNGLSDIIGGLTALSANATTDCGPVCQGTAQQLLAGAQALESGRSQLAGGLGDVSDGLGQVSPGLGGAIGALDTQLIPGAGDLAAGAGQAKAGAKQLKQGNVEVKGGLDQLTPALGQAIGGIIKLNAGAGDAAKGSGDLTTGLNKLNNGLGDLSAGTSSARAGSGQLAGGAGDLADGLVRAADGSRQLADGLGQASSAAPAIPDGAQRLSAEGTSQLAEAGEETAVDYGEMVAVLNAGAERAKTEVMAVGAPDGAQGLTAYSITLLEEEGAASRRNVRLVGGLVLLAGAGAIATARRRRA